MSNKYVYVRSRLLEFGVPTVGGDVFSPDSMRLSQATIVGKPVFRHEQDHDIRNAIGTVIDAESSLGNLNVLIALDSEKSNDIVNRVTSGELTQMSFGYRKENEDVHDMDKENFEFLFVSLIVNSGWDAPGVIIEILKPLPHKTNRLEQVE